MRDKPRYSRQLYNAYDLDLKKTVVIYAEQNGNKEAEARYGISEANIRRWRRLKSDIFSKSRNYERINTIKPDATKKQKIKKEKENYDYLDQDSHCSVDSMPLLERLSKAQTQEKITTATIGQVLKSQSLSPTKLKVTRQQHASLHGTKVAPRVVERPKSPVNEEMCLRWNSHHSNMQTTFPSILSKEQYVDVTLAAEGKMLKCHRLVLSSCSAYFDEILSSISPMQHPVLFMKDIPFWILKSLCDFMYAGEVHIFQNKLQELLTVAEILKIKGLAGKSAPPSESQQHQEESTSRNTTSTNPRTKLEKPDHIDSPYHDHTPINKEVRDTNKKRQNHIQEKPIQQHAPIQIKQQHVLTSAESTSYDYDNDDVIDPLELLEPLYEEAADERRNKGTIGRPPKDNKYQYQAVKKSLSRKLRKRKYSDQREPSPPQVFSSRKGTRSRPNVKIPKYYHTDFSKSSRQGSSSQSDPLLGVGEIKSEPIDFEDSGLAEYNDQQDQYTEHSPVLKKSNLLIYTSPSPASKEELKFKKIKLSKPVITEVHTVEEPSAASGGIELIKITLPKSRQSYAKDVDPLQDINKDDAIPSDTSSNVENMTIVSTEGAIVDQTNNEKNDFRDSSLLSQECPLDESHVEELVSDDTSQMEDGEEPPALSKENTIAIGIEVEEMGVDENSDTDDKYDVEGPPTLAKEVEFRDPMGIDDTLQTEASTMIDDTSEDEDDRPLVEYIPTLFNSAEDVEESKINTIKIHEVYSESDNVGPSTLEEMAYNNSINEDEDESENNCQIQIIETHSVSLEAEEMQCDEQIMTTTHLKNEVIGAVDAINTDVPPDIE